MKAIITFIVSLLLGSALWVLSIFWKFALGYGVGWVFARFLGAYVVTGLASLGISITVGVIPLIFGLVAAVSGLVVQIVGHN